MAQVRPFRAMRPSKGFEEKVIAKPYDVMDKSEASKMAEGNKYSFLHVTRSEIDLPKEDNPYADSVYEKAGENLKNLMRDGTYMIESKPMLYIYRQQVKDHVQTGIVGCVSIDDYEADVIKKHEFTRYDKEKDRERHFIACNADTEPVFITYRDNSQIRTLVEGFMSNNAPVYDIADFDGVSHRVWAINDDNVINGICGFFEKVDSLYIADGHHRAASAYKVGQMMREKHPQYTGREEFNFFPAVIYPDKDLKVLDHNRVVRDLNGNTINEFLDKIKNAGFEVSEPVEEGAKPVRAGEISMFLDNLWYTIRITEGMVPEDLTESLDVSVLQEKLLRPILGIEDIRNDERIDFVGGAGGIQELEIKTKNGMSVAFCMYPVTVAKVMEVSDAGLTMPPKSTWFEPKPASGLFIHLL